MSDPMTPTYKTPIILRLMGLIAACAITVPLAVILGSVVTDLLRDPPPILPAPALALIVIPYRMIQRRLRLTVSDDRATRRITRRIGRILLAFLAILTAVGLYALVVGPVHPLPLLIQAVFTLISWLLTGTANRGRYTDTFGDRLLGAAIILTLAAYIFQGLLSRPTPDTLLLVTFVYQASVWLALRNQANINRQMARGHHRLDELPPEIRTRNLRRVLMLAAILILAIVFRGPIARVVSGFFELLLEGIRALVRRLGSDSPPPPEEGIPLPEPTGGGGDQPMLPEGRSSRWWDLLWLVIGAALIYAVWVNRDQIVYAFRELWARLRAWVARVFSLGSAMQDTVTPGSGAYTDETLKLEKESWRDRRQRRKRAQHPEKALRKDARDLARRLRRGDTEHPDSWTAAEIRAVYRLVLRDLDLTERIAYRDTPRSILAHRRSRLEALGLDAERWTALYETVRYRSDADDRPTPLEPSARDAVLRALSVLSGR